MQENELVTHLQNTSIKAESSVKRIHNIQWIANLPKTGLAFRNKTKQLLITKIDDNEEIFIQYPGKESARIDERQRPWDFYPRVKRDNKYSSGLDFKAIWDILYEGLQHLIDDNKDWAAVIATMFYRMAYMNDHSLTQDPTIMYTQELEYNEVGNEIIISSGDKIFSSLYHYSPSKQILKEISRIVPLWGGMSFEAFLHYNELLAWNEDCKYFYRMNFENGILESKGWIRETGRVNTLLTHLSIIGYVAGKIHFSDICIKFARGKGVAAATRDEILRVCEPYITK